MDKKQIIKAVFAMCFVIACGGIYVVFYSPFGKSEDILFEKQADALQSEFGITEDDVSPARQESLSGDSAGEEKTEAEDVALLYVHICGAVFAEGVYALPAGSRVTDGIKAAGGFSDDADAAFHNLAAKVTDGQKIYVPTLQETEGVSLQERTEDDLSGTDGMYGSGTGSKVNLNTAGLAELMTLSGIGEAKAESIIKYREKVGRFQSIEELKKVSGIGDAMFERIREDIVVE